MSISKPLNASEQGFQCWPDVIEQPRLRFSRRVNTITLHHGRHTTYALQHKRHQGGVSLAGYLGEHLSKSRGVALAIVGR